MLEKTLESPLDCKEIQPIHSKGDQSWCSLEGLMLKVKLQYFVHLIHSNTLATWCKELMHLCWGPAPVDPGWFEGGDGVSILGNNLFNYKTVQFSSVAQSCPTLCDPMNRSTPGLPAHPQLPEFTQTRVHQVHDAIQPSHPQSSPSPPARNPSQHHSLFQWVNSSHEVAKVLEFQL